MFVSSVRQLPSALCGGMAWDDVDSRGHSRRWPVVGSSGGCGLRFSVAAAVGEGLDRHALSQGEAPPGGRPEQRRPRSRWSSQTRAGREERTQAGKTQTDHAAFSQRIGFRWLSTRRRQKSSRLQRSQSRTPLPPANHRGGTGLKPPKPDDEETPALIFSLHSWEEAGVFSQRVKVSGQYWLQPLPDLQRPWGCRRQNTRHFCWLSWCCKWPKGCHQPQECPEVTVIPEKDLSEPQTKGHLRWAGAQEHQSGDGADQRASWEREDSNGRFGMQATIWGISLHYGDAEWKRKSQQQ